MSVSPEDLGRGLYRPDPDDRAVRAALPVRPASARPQRRGARTGTVAAVTAGALSLAAAAAAATGALPAGKVGDVLSSAGGAITDAVSRKSAPPAPSVPTPSATALPAAPGTSVAALLAATAAHLDAGRLQPASATLTAALRGLERVPAEQRDPAEVARYGTLRARLVAALEGSESPGRSKAEPKDKGASDAPEGGEPRAKPAPRKTPHGDSGGKAPGQPSRDASAKPRA